MAVANAFEAPRQSAPLEYPEFRTVKHPPPSISEDVFAVPDHLDGDALVSSVRQALRHGRVAAEKAHAIAVATLNDETRTEAARHQAAADAIYKVTRAGLEQIDKASQRLAEKVVALEERLVGPPVPTNAIVQMQAMELRAALYAMKREDRRKVILGAIRRKNMALATAVLRTEPFLLGIEENEQEDYRRQWQQIACPAEAEYLHVIKEVQDHLSRGGSLLLGYSTELTSPVLVRRAEQAQKRVADALKAVA